VLLVSCRVGVSEQCGCHAASLVYKRFCGGSVLVTLVSAASDQSNLRLVVKCEALAKCAACKGQLHVSRALLRALLMVVLSTVVLAAPRECTGLFDTAHSITLLCSVAHSCCCCKLSCNGQDEYVNIITYVCAIAISLTHIATAHVICEQVRYIVQ
jgi:hypothetical protein